MPTTESGVTALELERVESTLAVLFERDDPFYSTIEKRPGERVSSTAMRMPLELRPGGISGHFNSDGGDLGLGDMPTYDKATVSTVEIIHRIEWTTRRKWATDNSRKAVLDAFRRDLVSAMKEFRRFNESLCMTAGNGVFGVVTSVANSGGVDYITCSTDGFGVRLMRFGSNVVIWNSTLTVMRGAGNNRVTFYDGPNKVIGIAALGTIIPGDLVVAGDLTSGTPASIQGVPYHASNASTGLWLTFNRATTPEVRANRVAAGGALALPMPRLLFNKIGDRTGQMMNRKVVAWMHPCQRQAYEELGQEAIQINKAGKEEGLDLYFNDNMRLAGAPLKTSFSWDKTRIDAVDMDVYGRAEFEPVQWYKDENGNRYFVRRGVSGGIAASNLAYIVASWNMYVTNPAAIGYIDTLSVPSGY